MDEMGNAQKTNFANNSTKIKHKQYNSTPTYHKLKTPKVRTQKKHKWYKTPKYNSVNAVALSAIIKG